MRRSTTRGRMRIQRRRIEKRHGSKGYQYSVLSITIPARFHYLFEPLLDFEFEMDVKDYGTFLRIRLIGMHYQKLDLLGVDFQLAKERKLELLLKACEPLTMQKLRSSYSGNFIPIGEPFHTWDWKKYPDLDSVPGQ